MEKRDVTVVTLDGVCTFDETNTITPIFVKSMENRLLFEAVSTNLKYLDPRISKWGITVAEESRFDQWKMLEIIVKTTAAIPPGFNTLLQADLETHMPCWRMGYLVSHFRFRYHVQLERMGIIDLVKGGFDPL